MMLGSVQQLLWTAPTRAEEREHQISRCWATPAPIPKVNFDRRFNTYLIPGGGYGSTDAG
jgi:crotonobetaine/carnitine-CoA ligase